MNSPLCCSTNCITAVFLVFLLGTAVAAAETHGQTQELPPTSYVLSVDDRAPGKRAMLRGDYERAIRAAERALRISQNLSAMHTLCAANIALQRIQDATTACNTAISIAERLISTQANPYGQRNRDGLAKAYSNRAVLHALQGDEAAALTDLQTAKRQKRIAETVAHNLAVAEARIQLAQH